MQVLVVKGERSKLHGAKCKLCPRTVRTGEAVLIEHAPNDAYMEDRFVYHVECMKALVDRAPQGVPVLNVKTRRAAIREAVDGGDLYGRPLTAVG